MQKSYETPLLTRLTIAFSVITLLFSLIVIKNIQETEYIVDEYPTANVSIYDWSSNSYDSPEVYSFEYLEAIHKEASSPHVMSEEENFKVYISRLCDFYGVDEQIVKNLIQVESGWKPEAVSLSCEYVGIMQISKKWQSERAKRLGVTDMMDPYSNILIGIDFLAYTLNETGHDYAWALMIYNEGYKSAFEKHMNGVISDYAREIMQI